MSGIDWRPELLDLAFSSFFKTEHWILLIVVVCFILGRFLRK